MRFVKNSLLFFLFVCFSFCGDWVVGYKDAFYGKDDFYSFFPENEWKKLSFEKRKGVISGFIKRKACLYEAKALGLSYSVDLHKKLSNRFDRLLVNEYYMNSFLGELIPEKALRFCKKNLERDVFVSHILLPFPLSVQDSLDTKILALQIKEKVVLGFSFDSLVTLYSSDPSASKNFGELGWVSIGQTVPAFQNKAFSLCLGCVGIAKTTFGYHVLKVDSLKKSDYSTLKKEDYDSFAFRFASSYIKEDLSVMAAAHDSLVLKKNSFAVDTSALSFFVNKIIAVSSAPSTGSSDLFLDSLRSFDKPLLMINSDVFSGKWLASQFEWGLYKSPFYNSVPLLTKEINLVALRFIVKRLALKANLDLSYSFVSQYSSVKEALIEKAFLKNLKTSVPAPTKKETTTYFNNNKLLFVNPKTKEPYLLESAFGTVEASLLKNKQEEASSSFLSSLSSEDFVKINEDFLYEK